MAQKLKLKFNSEYFPLTKGSFQNTPQNKQTKTETEAGTIIRDIKRLGVPHLSVTSTIDDTWFQKIYNYYVSVTALTVYFLDPSTLSEGNFSGFIENLTFNAIKDNGTLTFWEVSFEVTAY